MTLKELKEISLNVLICVWFILMFFLFVTSSFHWFNRIECNDYMKIHGGDEYTMIGFGAGAKCYVKIDDEWFSDFDLRVGKARR